MTRIERPFGYLTGGDVAQMCELKGQQVYYFMQDYGCKVGSRMCIKPNYFYALLAEGKISPYKAYPMYSAQIHKKGLKREYRKRVGKLDAE